MVGRGRLAVDRVGRRAGRNKVGREGVGGLLFGNGRLAANHFDLASRFHGCLLEVKGRKALSQHYSQCENKQKMGSRSWTLGFLGSSGTV